MTTPRRRNWRSERATGVLSASIGLTFFLAFLLLSTQIAANLFATSALRSDVAHATHAAVSDRVRRNGSVAVEAEMERQSAWLVQRYQRGHPQISWQHDDPDWLTLTVTVDSPSQLAGVAGDVLAMKTITATSRVRLEEPR
jgi:hypothetical protein